MPRIDVIPINLSTSLRCDKNENSENKQPAVAGLTLREALKFEALEELREHFTKLEANTKPATKWKLGDMLFYQLVQGGNVDMVSEILDHVRHSDLNLYDYLLSGKRPRDVKTGKLEMFHGKSSSWNRNLLATLVYCLLLIPLFLFTTPFFYFWHAASLAYMQRRKVFKTLKLPLLFCAFSKNLKMINLFAEHSKTILRCIDDDGNNVFHYLATISIKQHRRSVQYFKMLRKVFGLPMIRDVLVECKNSNGLTALELAVMTGSPLYFTHLLNVSGILKQTALEISERFLRRQGGVTLDSFEDTNAAKPQSNSTDKEHDECDSVSDSERKHTDKSYRLDYYDVTKYERGDVVGENSFLLNLIAFRDLLKMTKEEVQSIANCDLIIHWLKFKVKSMYVAKIFQDFGVYFLYLVLLQYILFVNVFISSQRMTIYFWDSLHQAVSQNITLTQLNKNSTLIEFMEPTIQQITAACGFDVSPLLSLHGNATAVVYSSGQMSGMFMDFLYTRLLLVISWGIIIADMHIRLTFLTRCYFCPGWSTRMLSVGAMCRPIFSRPMQASYLARQMSVTSSCFVLAMQYFFSLSNRIVALDFASANLKSFYLTGALLFAVGGTCLRFFELLYSLRTTTLCNVSSELLLTMCKLFIFIVQFASLYVGISFFFAALFTLVVQDPSCPNKPLYPFDTWRNGMIGVFKLMMGDNMLPVVMSWELLSTYSIYVILTAIVLLSMVTGISGSIADRVLSRDLLGILTKVESLQIAIDAESGIYSFSSFVFKYFHKLRLLKSNSVVVESESSGEISKVSIKVEKLVNV